MKKKIAMLLIAAMAAGMMPATAFAELKSQNRNIQAAEPQQTRKIMDGGQAEKANAKDMPSAGAAGVAFTIERIKVLSGTRKTPASELVISEAEAGLLKKGQAIYLQVKNLRFEDTVEFEMISGDGKVKKVEADGEILKIEIEKATSKEPFEIKLTNISLFLDGSLPNGTYALDLVTKRSDEFKNNFLGDTYDEDGENGKFGTETVILLGNYVEILRQDSYVGDYDENGGIQSKAEIVQGASVMKVSGKEAPLLSPAYQKEDGTVMLPVRALVEAMAPSANITYDAATKQTVILLNGSARIVGLTPGKSTMKVNGTEVPLKTPAELTGGSLFLSLADFGLLMGIPNDRIHWEEETLTATLNG